MRLIGKACLAAGAMAALFSIHSTAVAQVFGYPLYAGTWVNERIPYFAQHPPVYYKRPVSRPYGYSPYAYPPGYITPERTARRPEVVILENPYVPGQPAAVAEPPRAKPQPLVINNPFVVP